MRDGGEFAQRLAHEPCLQTHVSVAHFALDFRARNESGHGVDDHKIDRSRAHERLGDIERLLAGVRLRHEKLVGLDADLLGVRHVERVLRVNEGADAAGTLRLGDRMKRERRLAARLGSEDLDDATARIAANARCKVDRERAARQRRDGFGNAFVAKRHDGTTTKLLLDGLADGLDLAEFVGVRVEHDVSLLVVK